ncbi:MAG: hypothetical protein RMJ36_02110 [Candidatus Calescibacterium sp.]|nr:hypothetical protein [Candidatus Calescibacterium sp.]MDW8132433.1 hypothetical protein [Candidatus Calescibacterium sp.]
MFKEYEKGRVKIPFPPTSPIVLILLSSLLFFIYSCATGVPTLNPNIPTNKLLSVSLFFKSNINPVIQYENNGQDFTYYFYVANFFRFDDGLISNNLDLIQHIFYFQNGFKRINRVSPPSANTSTQDEWSSIIIDNNSQIISNRELRFNILIPDDIIGNKSYYKFIILVFLRNYEYQSIDDNFGQDPVHYFDNPSYSINIDLNSIEVGRIYVLNNPFNDVVNINLPIGFPEDKKDGLIIERVEYVYRVF